MAEWFKASDLRPDINDAWVRTPLGATSFCLFFEKIKRKEILAAKGRPTRWIITATQLKIKYGK